MTTGQATDAIKKALKDFKPWITDRTNEGTIYIRFGVDGGDRLGKLRISDHASNYEARFGWCCRTDEEDYFETIDLDDGKITFFSPDNIAHFERKFRLEAQFKLVKPVQQ